MTKIGWRAFVNSTTLESNKSPLWMSFFNSTYFLTMSQVAWDEH
jgi:hypothetical protein